MLPIDPTKPHYHLLRVHVSFSSGINKRDIGNGAVINVVMLDPDIRLYCGKKLWRQER